MMAKQAVVSEVGPEPIKVPQKEIFVTVDDLVIEKGVGSLKIALDAAFPGQIGGVLAYSKGREICIWADEGVDEAAVKELAAAHVPVDLIVDLGPLGGLTTAEAEAWIEAQVLTATDLDGLLAVFKALARRLIR